jgi:hypothetical protein
MSPFVRASPVPVTVVARSVRRAATLAHRLLSMLFVGASVLLVGACSSSARSASVTTVLRAADIPNAVAALRSARPGEIRFTEINVTPDGVNLFVAADAEHEVSYYFSHGALGAPGAVAPLSGPAYGLDGVALDRGATMIATSERRFAGSLAVGLSLVQAPQDGLVWIVRVRGPRGGFRNEYYDPAGSFRYADLDTAAGAPVTTSMATGVTTSAVSVTSVG